MFIHKDVLPLYIIYEQTRICSEVKLEQRFAIPFPWGGEESDRSQFDGRWVMSYNISCTICPWGKQEAIHQDQNQKNNFNKDDDEIELELTWAEKEVIPSW